MTTTGVLEKTSKPNCYIPPQPTGCQPQIETGPGATGPMSQANRLAQESNEQTKEDTHTTQVPAECSPDAADDPIPQACSYVVRQGIAQASKPPTHYITTLHPVAMQLSNLINTLAAAARQAVVRSPGWVSSDTVDASKTGWIPCGGMTQPAMRESMCQGRCCCC
jgi:hypothetical protein